MNQPPQAGEPTTASPTADKPHSPPSEARRGPQATGDTGLACILDKGVDVGKAAWDEHHNNPYEITVSEIASILGVGFDSPFTMFHKKRGDLPGFEGNISTRAGHMLEPLIAELYEEETGRKTLDTGDFTIWRHPDFPWLLCTPDRLDYDLRVVELKALGLYSKADWKDGKGPLGYQVQNQGQLACMELDHGSLAGLIGNQEFYYHDFDRHDKFIKNMISKLLEFRERLANNDPPPIDGSVSSTEALKFLHPKDKQVDNVVYEDHMAAFMKERKKIKDQQAHLERDLTLVENKLKDTIGDNTELWANGMKMTWKWQHRRGGYHKAGDSRVLIGPS